MAQIKKEFLIVNLVESGFLLKEEDSKFVIMEKPIEGFSYLKSKVAVSNDGKIIYLGIITDNNMGISTVLEIEIVFTSLGNDAKLINELRQKAEAL